MFNSGNEFYRLDGPVPADLIGKEFSEAVAFMAKRRILLVGFETTYSEELKQQLPDDLLHSFDEN